MERQFANTDELTINALIVPLPPVEEVLMNRHIVAFDWWIDEPVSFVMTRQRADSDTRQVTSLIPLRG
jgi:hypothetical protein